MLERLKLNRMEITVMIINHLFFKIYVIYETVMLTCHSVLEMFWEAVVGERHIERLRPSERETPLILGPVGKIRLISKELAIMEAH